MNDTLKSTHHFDTESRVTQRVRRLVSNKLTLTSSLRHRHVQICLPSLASTRPYRSPQYNLSQQPQNASSHSQYHHPRSLGVLHLHRRPSRPPRSRPTPHSPRRPREIPTPPLETRARQQMDANPLARHRSLRARIFSAMARQRRQPGMRRMHPRPVRAGF